MCADWYFARANFLTLTIFIQKQFVLFVFQVTSLSTRKYETRISLYSRTLGSLQQTLPLKIYDFAHSCIKLSKIGGSAVLQPNTIVLKSIVITSLENCRYHSKRFFQKV